MAQSFRVYCEELQWRSHDQLRRSAKELVDCEKKYQCRLIAHLAEISRRKLHLEWGYEHLFDYCRRSLGLSEGSIALRIQVANVCRRFPQLLNAIAERKLSLTVAGRLAPHLSEANVVKLIDDCSGMTRSQVDEYVTRFAPKPVLQGMIRRAPARRVGSGDRGGLGPSSAANGQGGGRPQESAGSSRAAATRPVTEAAPMDAAPFPCADSSPRRGSVRAARPDVFNFSFSGDAHLKGALERLAEVSGIDDVAGNMAELFALALDLALEKRDPQRRHARRERRSGHKALQQSAPPASSFESSSLSGGGGHAGEPTPAPKQQDAPKQHDAPKQQDAPKEQDSPCPDKVTCHERLEPTRHVPVAVRDRVLARAAYQCQYRGPDGTRCSARTHLEIEHTKPFSVFQSHDEAHLRAYCRPHNAWAAERTFGAGFVSRKIEERRTSKAL